MIGVQEGPNQIQKIAKIKVIGVGGGGNNAVNRMIDDGIKDIEFIALNTDYNVLAVSKAPKQIQLGQKLTRGLGAGGSAEVGRKSAEETRAEIEEALEGTDLVFVTAGMGGGTGTGASPVVAQIAKSKGILTIGVVTTPFKFEGRKRMQDALNGVAELKNNVDSLIVIPNEKLMGLSEEKLTIKNAFKKADDILVQGVRGIYDIINDTADINVDFADLHSVTVDKGIAHMGVGVGSGKNKTEIAIKMAINSPLLDTSIKGAKSVLINFYVDANTGIDEINEAVDIVGEIIDPDANIYFGCTTITDADDFVSVTVIATGLDDNETMFTNEPTKNNAPNIAPQQTQPMQNQQPTQNFNQGQAPQQPQQYNQQQEQQYNNQPQPTYNASPQQPMQQQNQQPTQNSVSFDTSPNVQPVSYQSQYEGDSDTSPTQKLNRFKIHGIFSDSSKFPDIDR